MTADRPTVLIVGGDADGELAADLRGRDWEVVLAPDGEAALQALDARPFDGVVTELEAPGVDGMEVLRRARGHHADLGVVIVADAVPAERVVAALRAGAADVLTRPIHGDHLAAVLERALAHQRQARRLAEVEERLDERFGFERLAGRSGAIARVRDQIRHVAALRATVLIEGKAGTGKGLVARIIHQRGPRRAEPFVALSCRHLREADLSNEDGPSGSRTRGWIEQTNRGTLNLEDVESLSRPLQEWLLRFIQSRELEPGGGRGALRVDARLIVSTERDLEAEVHAGRFREDLYLKLSAVRIAIPPLRERPEDLAPLVQAILAEVQREHGRRVKGLTRGAFERLARHEWPGNVRELQILLERMVVLAAEEKRGTPVRLLGIADLPPHLRDADGPDESLRITVGMTAAEVERRLIEATMREAGHDKPRAAAMLGIGLRTLYRKLLTFGIRGGPAGPREARTSSRVRAKPGRRRRR